MTTFSAVEKAEIVWAIDFNREVNEELYDKLYNHFCQNSEMPYGVAKARTGDPSEWIAQHMHEVL
jgi:hypothetical protein